MIFPKKIQDAIHFAIQTHQLDQDQKRKGTEIPYIIHPLSVGLILTRVNASEDVIIAGILHDAIEDSIESKKVTKQLVAQQFGEKVAKVVDDVTEQDKSLPWAERKRLALAHIAEMDHDSLLVKSADCLQNLTDFIYQYKQQGESMFQFFSAPKDDLINNHKKRIEALTAAWSDNPLLSDLQENLSELFSLIGYN